MEYIAVYKTEAREEERNGCQGYAYQNPDGFWSWMPKKSFERQFFPVSSLKSVSENDASRLMERGETIHSQLGDVVFSSTTLPTGWKEVEVKKDYGASVLSISQESESTIRGRIREHLEFILKWAVSGVLGGKSQ